METVLMYLLFVVGVILIIKGGDWFVDGAAWIAEVTGIPKFIVGATIVSIATTLPEIIVSSMAAIEGHELLRSGVADAQLLAQAELGMAIGNGVGSVICNTAMIMALGIMFDPTEVDRKKFSYKAILQGITVVALLVLAFKGSLSLKASIVLLVIFVSFIAESIKNARTDIVDDFEEKAKTDKKTVAKNILYIVAGAVFIVVGSRLLVNNGGKIAVSWGVSGSVVGVTMVAIGTSLPELVTAVTAVVKKQPSMSVGNIIGANIIDIALILPLCSFIYGGVLPVSAQNVYLDFPVCILVSLIALVPTVIAKRFRRWQGVVLLVIYVAYLVIVASKLDWYLSLFNTTV